MNEVEQSLKSIAKGTIFSFMGIFLALFLSFLQRWTIIRITTPYEYGLYSLSLATIAIFLSIGSLGLYEGITRTISFKFSEESSQTVKIKAFSSLIIISVLSGGACILILRIGAPFISSLFDKDITRIVQVISLSIPFSLLLEFLVSFYRGIEKTQVKVFFSDFLRNCLFFSLLLVILLKKMSFQSVIWVYVISVVLSAVAILLYSLKDVGIPRFTGIRPITRDMLLFSLPLLGGTVFTLITQWADTLLLGVFKSTEEVAFYSAALPTSKLIQTTMGAFLFIYLPVATSLYSRGLKKEMKRVYAVISKWVMVFTFPLFLILFLNADILFSFLYGSEYQSAVLPFRIITIGYVIRDAFGPNGGALIAMGKTRVMMVIVSLIALTNLISNVFLIPPLGMVGAALSMIITLVTASLLKGGMLYKIAKIHPVRWNYVKPFIGSLVLIGGFQVMVSSFTTVTVWELPFLLVIYIMLYLASMILTRSVDEEDIWMLLLIERRLGINLTLFKKFMKRFL
jgi:O-antigen/teichoic acid export membrane protein